MTKITAVLRFWLYMERQNEKMKIPHGNSLATGSNFATVLVIQASINVLIQIDSKPMQCLNFGALYSQPLLHPQTGIFGSR